MVAPCSRVMTGSRSRWLMTAVVAVGLALASRGASAQSIASLSATQGELGSYVTIFGTDFGDTMGQSYVLLGDRALPAVFWSRNAITAYVMPQNTATFPRGTAQDLVVVVQPGNKRSNTMAFTVAGISQDTTPGTTPGTDTGTQPADPTRQALNDSLLIERLAAQFFNQNASKAYLTTPVTTPPGTTPDTTPGTDTGTTPDTTPTNGGTPPNPAAGISQDTTPGTTPGTGSTISLSGAEEIPPVTTSGSGTATFTLNEAQRQLAYEVRVTGLSGPATAMHLHRGARGEEGDVVYPLNTPDANGMASGTTEVMAADIPALRAGGFYLNVHTDANPEGEVRGQLVLAQEPTPGTTPGITPGTPSASNLAALRGLVEEIRANHNAHVATLEQALGTQADPVPTFRNTSLDATTLQQFLEMAQMIEDAAVGVHQNNILSLFQTPTATAPGTLPEGQTLLGTLVAIALVDARHAGGIRAYRKTVSTAEGGDPNIPLSEEGALSVPRTREQFLQFTQTFLDTGTTPGTTPGTTTPGTTTPGTTTPGTTTPGTTTPGTTTPGTTTPGTTTPGTTTPGTGTGTSPAAGGGPY